MRYGTSGMATTEQATALTECATLLDQAEAAGMAYLAALSAATLAPDPAIRRAAEDEARVARDMWLTVSAALTAAVSEMAQSPG